MLKINIISVGKNKDEWIEGAVSLITQSY